MLVGFIPHPSFLHSPQRLTCARSESTASRRASLSRSFVAIAAHVSASPSRGVSCWQQAHKSRYSSQYILHIRNMPVQHCQRRRPYQPPLACRCHSIRPMCYSIGAGHIGVSYHHRSHYYQLVAIPCGSFLSNQIRYCPVYQDVEDPSSCAYHRLSFLAVAAVVWLLRLSSCFLLVCRRNDALVPISRGTLVQALTDITVVSPHPDKPPVSTGRTGSAFTLACQSHCWTVADISALTCSGLFVRCGIDRASPRYVALCLCLLVSFTHSRQTGVKKVKLIHQTFVTYT